MPSPIGHSLAGLCGYFVAPGLRERPRGASALALSLLLANLPDADILLGLSAGAIGRFHRAASHSLLAALAVGLAVGAVSRWRARGEAVAWGLWGGCLYLSHLVLDLMVRDPSAPYGIQLLWPVSGSYLISPFTPFRRFDYADPGHGLIDTVLSYGNFLTVSREILLLAPCAGLFWLIGRFQRAPQHRP
jgi:inner membrane protein